MKSTITRLLMLSLISVSLIGLAGCQMTGNQFLKKNTAGAEPAAQLPGDSNPQFESVDHQRQELPEVYMNELERGENEPLSAVQQTSFSTWQNPYQSSNSACASG